MDRSEESATSLEIAVPDEELCRRIQVGDPAAEERLVKRLQPRLRLAALRATRGNTELTQEICQDTMVIVLKRLRGKGLLDASRFAEFATQTARNLAIAQYRKSSHRCCRTDSEVIEALGDAARGQLEILSSHGLHRLIYRIIQELPTHRDRTILERYYLREEEKREICRDLHLSSLLFNRVLFRARNRFRARLETAGYGREDLLS